MNFVPRQHMPLRSDYLATSSQMVDLPVPVDLLLTVLDDMPATSRIKCLITGPHANWLAQGMRDCSSPILFTGEFVGQELRTTRFASIEDERAYSLDDLLIKPGPKFDLVISLATSSKFSNITGFAQIHQTLLNPGGKLVMFDWFTGKIPFDRPLVPFIDDSFMLRQFRTSELLSRAMEKAGGSIQKSLNITASMEHRIGRVLTAEINPIDTSLPLKRIPKPSLLWLFDRARQGTLRCEWLEFRKSIY